MSAMRPDGGASSERSRGSEARRTGTPSSAVDSGSNGNGSSERALGSGLEKRRLEPAEPGEAGKRTGGAGRGRPRSLQASDAMRVSSDSSSLSPPSPRSLGSSRLGCSLTEGLRPPPRKSSATKAIPNTSATFGQLFPAWSPPARRDRSSPRSRLVFAAGSDAPRDDSGVFAIMPPDSPQAPRAL